MKVLLSLTFSFLVFNHSLACDCVFLKEYQTQADLEEIEYIAHVKIDTVFVNQPQKDDSYYYEARISTIEQFKGGISDSLIVYGGLHGLTEWMTSCDIGLNQGQEWIIFSNKDDSGKPSASACTYSVFYQNAEGLKRWFHQSSLATAEKLRQIFNKDTSFDSTKTGVFTRKYSNGNVELIETYQNGLLNGTREVFDPKGEKIIKESFKNGLRNGKQLWYYSTGQVYRAWNFKSELPSDTCYYFHKNGQVNYERIFNDKGKMVSNKELSPDGIIKSRSHYYYEKNFYENIRYYENGLVWYRNRYTIDSSNDIYTEEFHPNGQMSALWDYTISNDTTSHLFKKWDINGQQIINRIYKTPHEYIDLPLSKKK